MRDVAVIEGDDDVAVQAMERILEINPDDFDTRFSLAYKYSEKENHDLSFYHYLKIPSNKRSSVVWNNLGVGFQHFSLPAKSVSAYCKSADAGETLAMSNLGYKLMQAGFLAEAETEFGRALVIADFHKNVGEGMAALRDVRENETKRQVEILEKASKKISFFQKLGRAVAKPDATTIHDAWKGPECPLTLSIDGSLFCAFGKYERAPSSLLKGLLGEAVKPTQHEVKYTGTICGNRIIGTVKRTKIGKKATTSSIIGGADVDVKFALVIDDENLKISVAENLKHTEPMFYDFHQI